MSLPEVDYKKTYDLSHILMRSSKGNPYEQRHARLACFELLKRMFTEIRESKKVKDESMFYAYQSILSDLAEESAENRSWLIVYKKKVNDLLAEARALQDERLAKFVAGN